MENSPSLNQKQKIKTEETSDAGSSKVMKDAEKPSVVDKSKNDEVEKVKDELSELYDDMGFPENNAVNVNLFANPRIDIKPKENELQTRQVEEKKEVKPKEDMRSAEDKAFDDERKKEIEERLKKFYEKSKREDKTIVATNEDVENFVDWCMGHNRFGFNNDKYDPKGTESTNQMASELSSFVIGRIGFTGIGVALISTGVLAWAGIIIIAYANTPNAITTKLKDYVSKESLGVIPLDKITNLSEDIVKYANDTHKILPGDKEDKRLEKRAKLINDAKKKVGDENKAQANPKTPILPSVTTPPVKDNKEKVKPEEKILSEDDRNSYNAEEIRKKEEKERKEKDREEKRERQEERAREKDDKKDAGRDKPSGGFFSRLPESSGGRGFFGR